MLVNLGPSVIRTVVPLIVGLVVAQLASRGFHFPADGLVTDIVTAVVSSAYYTVARVLETRLGPAWGRLLGHVGGPTYGATAQASTSSPTGEVATGADATVPVGTPVQTIPMIAVSSVTGLPVPGNITSPSMAPDPSASDVVAPGTSGAEAPSPEGGYSLVEMAFALLLVVLAVVVILHFLH